MVGMTLPAKHGYSNQIFETASPWVWTCGHRNNCTMFLKLSQPRVWTRLNMQAVIHNHNAIVHIMYTRCIHFSYILGSVSAFLAYGFLTDMLLYTSNLIIKWSFRGTHMCTLQWPLHHTIIFQVAGRRHHAMIHPSRSSAPPSGQIALLYGISPGINDAEAFPTVAKALSASSNSAIAPKEKNKTVTWERSSFSLPVKLSMVFTVQEKHMFLNKTFVQSRKA